MWLHFSRHRDSNFISSELEKMDTLIGGNGNFHGIVDQTGNLHVRLGPRNSVIKQRRMSARQHLTQFRFGQFKSLGQSLRGFPHGPNLAIGERFKKGEHHCLEVWNGHCL